MPSVSILKTTAITLAAALVIGTAMPVASAVAGPKKHKGEWIAAGVIGLALGAIIADTSQRRRRNADRIYYDTQPYVPTQPVEDYGYEYYQPVEPYRDYGYREAPHGPRYEDDYPQTIYQNPAYQPETRPRIRAETNVKPSGPNVITYEQAMAGSQAGIQAGGEYGASTEPWSAGWLSYCQAKFRSFNSNSGTYLGYDGKRHFCVVK